MKKRIILFKPYARPRYWDRVWQQLVAYGFETKIITGDDKHIHPNSCVLLPDTGGFNPNVSYLSKNNPLPPKIKGQDPLMEYFRLNLLHYYVSKRIPIFGLGTCALLTFAEVLKGELFYGKDGLYPEGQIHKHAFWDTPDFFRSIDPRCGGYLGNDFNDDVLAYIDEHMFGNPELVPVEIPPSGPNKLQTVEL